MLDEVSVWTIPRYVNVPYFGVFISRAPNANLTQFQILWESKQFSASKCPSSRGWEWGNLRFTLFFFRFSLLGPPGPGVQGAPICSPGAAPWALRFGSSPDKDHQLPTDRTHWSLASSLFFPSSSHHSLLFISPSLMCINSYTVPLKTISTISKAGIWA